MEDEDRFDFDNDGDFIGDLTAATIAPDSYVIHGTTAGITATNPGAQLDNPITTEVFEVSTVANAADAVTLPTAVAGLSVYIINNGANSLEIWPYTSDNAGAGVDTAINLAAGANLHLIAYDAVNWETF